MNYYVTYKRSEEIRAYIVIDDGPDMGYAGVQNVGDATKLCKDQADELAAILTVICQGIACEVMDENEVTVTCILEQ